ncbi:MAG: glycosyltransferase 87 family protein [Candidatus Limnocylindrales bacterium]
MSATPRQAPAEPGRLVNLAAFAGALFLALFGLGLLVFGKAVVGYDARVYWAAWQHGLYPSGAALVGGAAYLYSPAFAQASLPLTWLPLWAFRALDSTACALAFVWLLWPLPWRLKVPLLAACAPAIAMGNVQVFLLAVAVAGLRYPALWAFKLLTKVSPGVGVLWFAGKRDWHGLAIALGTTCLVALGSFAVAPDLWARWIEVLETNAAVHGSDMFLAGYLPATSIVLRTAFAALLVLWGGWRGKPWTVVAAVILAQPDAGIDVLILLAAGLPPTIIGEPMAANVPGETTMPSRRGWHQALTRGQLPP